MIIDVIIDYNIAFGIVIIDVLETVVIAALVLVWFDCGSIWWVIVFFRRIMLWFLLASFNITYFGLNEYDIWFFDSSLFLMKMSTKGNLSGETIRLLFLK